MDSNYWNRGCLSRRSVLRGATLAGVGLTGAALIGCGGSDEGDSTAAPTPSGTGATQLTNTPTSSDVKTGGTLRVRSL